MKYIEPYETGLASSASAVGRKLGQLLTIMGQVDHHIAKGSLPDELREMQLSIREKLEAEGWRVTIPGNKFKVLPPNKASLERASERREANRSLDIPDCCNYHRKLGTMDGRRCMSWDGSVVFTTSIEVEAYDLAGQLILPPNQVRCHVRVRRDDVQPTMYDVIVDAPEAVTRAQQYVIKRMNELVPVKD
jgi:hypothetical protein